MNPEQDIEQGLDIDYDAVYGGVEVDQNDYVQPKEIKNDFKTIFKDVSKQFLKNTVIGTGTAGDLLELAGAQSKEVPRGERFQRNKENEALERLNTPGNKPSFSDIEDIQEDPTIAQSWRPLHSTSELEEFNEKIGGPGEPETHPGKYLARGGKNYGAGLLFGDINPIPSILAGAAGQGLEDLGVGPTGQIVGELATMALTQGGKVLFFKKGILSSGRKELQSKIEQLRKLGYNDEQINLAVNARKSWLKRYATRNGKTNEALETAAQKSEELVSKTLQNAFPGIEKGVGELHNEAAKIYEGVVQMGSKVPITNPNKTIDTIQNTVAIIKNTLSNSAEEKTFIKFIEEAAENARKNPTADAFIDFYQKLNSQGKWLDPRKKEKLITDVKDSIKATFRDEGKIGQQLADNFEFANKQWKKFKDAEEVAEFLGKSTTSDGIDFVKLNKQIQNPDNKKMLIKNLGKEEADNLTHIARTGKEIKDFDKSFKIASGLPTNALDVITGGGVLYYVAKGDYTTAAEIAGSKLARIGIGRLAEKALIDPKYQRLHIKLLNAIKNSAPVAFKNAKEQMDEYLAEEGIDVKL